MVLVAVAFGGIVGFGLGRRPEDRRPSLFATAFATAAGLITWLTRSSPGAVLAAVSLTAGGAAALGVLMVLGRTAPDR